MNKIHRADRSKLPFKLDFSISLNGDTLWKYRDLYAVSDGTPPNECDVGPYLVDTARLRREPLHFGVSHEGLMRAMIPVTNHDNRLESYLLPTAFGIGMRLFKQLELRHGAFLLVDVSRSKLLGPSTAKIGLDLTRLDVRTEAKELMARLGR